MFSFIFGNSGHVDFAYSRLSDLAYQLNGPLNMINSGFLIVSGIPHGLG